MELLLKQLTFSLIYRKGKVFFLNELPQVDEGIAHSAKSRIDADIGLIGNFLETETAVMPEKNNLSLIVGQFIDQNPDLRFDLTVDDQFFNIAVRKFPGVEQVHLRIVIGNGVHLFFLPEMVDDQVVGNADHPGKEFAIILVFSRFEGLYDLDKCLLKEIFSQLLILNGKNNVGKYLASVPVYKDFDG